MSLAGKNVLVVAPYSPGVVLARALAEAGARVILHGGARGSRTAGPSDDSIEVLNDPLDTVEQTEGLAAKCWDSFGPLNGLVLVPEEATADDFTDSDDDWQAAIRSALQLPFFLARAVAARMSDVEGACIVYVVGTESHGTEEEPAVNDVTRSASVTTVLALAKALPKTVRVGAVVYGTNPSGRDAIGTANTVRFLLGEDSLPSGAIVHVQPNLTAES
jgi:NAD(P)-dependent dehydrogenase (short-subunit alcohol dehydrogenase family)